MAKMVTLTIDGVQVEVPDGTLVVDAAKKAGIDIPVFCYHPKMEPVGMCRMCLVELGRPVVDRTTGEIVLEEDGSPKIQYSPKLETACTTPVSQGMVVIGASDKVKAGREDILEFLLTSHPLDCPICDKGGECPLQNLTMGFGPGESRYLYNDKKHMDKHIPLGELIYLDRERCIQCARCVRFQDVIVDDPVIGFFQRGRSLEIVTYSDPGFDSYWSGNTTDICPVGALTTADFRFGARPWELQTSASICNHCPVGCNITLSLRREAASGGRTVVKRVMPRQNEAVNELWICDKGRFGHHFASHRASEGNPPRLQQPLVRQEGELVPTTWEHALELVAKQLEHSGDGLLTLAGGRLANEDLFNLGELTDALGGEKVLYTHMGGGEFTKKIGFSSDTNFSEMGQGSTILVVGCDLEEEAPIWWLRVKQAAERGAVLIVLNSRQTKLDRYATYSIRYPFGAAASTIIAMEASHNNKKVKQPEPVEKLQHNEVLQQAGRMFAESDDAIVLYGSDGMGLVESNSLAQACANLLISTGHTGRPNNGLLGVWPRANDQGAWELGWKPKPDLKSALQEAQFIYIAAADPQNDDPAFQSAFGGDKFVVVQELFMTQTARLADVVLPVQSWTEREGSYTSGERRVQRFYPALSSTTSLPKQTESLGYRHATVLTALLPMLDGPQPDYKIPVLLADRLGVKGMVATSASAVFANLSQKNPVFKDLSFQKLAEVKEQWPIVGREDLYYGGTGYENAQGLGVQLPYLGGELKLGWPQVADWNLPKLGLMAFPITRLYDRGTTLLPSQLLRERIGEPYVLLNAQDAGRLKIEDGDMVRITFSGSGTTVAVQAMINNELPERVLLVPRSFGIPIMGPILVELKRES